MNKQLLIFILLMFLLSAFLSTCKKPFDPVVITINYNYLAVDGFINTGSNSVTTIILSRTRTIADTTNVPELNAQVSIVSSNGASYNLQQSGNNGAYVSNTLNLDTTQTYQLAITASDGSKYASDFVPCKQAPPIDSISWQQQNGVNIYVNTHDPNNNTHYYKWDFTETWQYRSTLQNYWGESNGFLFVKDSTTQTYICWYTDNSTNVLLGSSIALSQDVITQAPITVIPNDDVKINFRYSILVRQHALTADAYNYWLIIQKTSQQLGSLFDVQPSQITGNFHSLTNPNTPVIGFLSATSEQQQRIFVSNDQLSYWPYNNSLEHGCPLAYGPADPSNILIYIPYSDTSYAPYYFANSSELIFTKRVCIDCTEFGGTNQKPPFW